MFENKKPLDKKQIKNRAPSRKPPSGQTIQRLSICTYTPRDLKYLVPDENKEKTMTVGINSFVKIDGYGVTSGSAPSSPRDGIYKYLPKHIRGHIVSQSLGGEGIAQNLFPFSSRTNQLHFRQIELPAIIALRNFIAAHKNGDQFCYHCWLTGNALAKEPLSDPKEVDNIRINSECYIKSANGRIRPVNTGACSAKVYDPDFDGRSINITSISGTHMQTRKQSDEEYLESLKNFIPSDSVAYRYLKTRFGESATHSELLQIAQYLANIYGLGMRRIEKRDFIALIKWFDDNWDRIRPIIDYITLSDKPAH